MTQISEKEWIDQNWNEFDDENAICPDCAGSGGVPEVCFSCGHEKDETVDCQRCDVDCRVPFSTMSSSEKKDALREIFAHQAGRDAERFKAWTGRDLQPS